MTQFYECAHCQKTFNCKSNLSRHINSIHSEDKLLFECPHCQKKLSCQSNLKRHIKGTHSENKQKFECPHCQKTCGHKSNLTQHINRTHCENKQKFECSQCQKTFTCTSNLRRHIKGTHSEDRKKYECSTCGKKFARHYVLTEHVNTHDHVPVQYPQNLAKNFACSICGATYIRKEHLARHTRLKHENDELECAYCSSKFGQERLLIRHINLRHSGKNQVTDGPELKCLKCGVVFRRRNDLNKHYVAQHDIAFQFEEHHFASSEKFDEWLHNEQHQTITQFKKSHHYNTLSNSVRRFKCCRSRGYWNLPNTNDRKRCLKVSGYKGLGGFCPAEVIVTTFRDGTCKAKYQKTHVGHEVGDTKELKHIYMSKSEKLDIAAKIQSGIPRSLIFKQKVLSTAQTGKIDRSSVLNNYDLHNIAAKYKLDFENCPQPCDDSDSISTEALITQHRDDILFYKRQGDEDDNFHTLDDEDFVLVIMNKEQEVNLRRYGHNVVIAMDETYSANPYNFILHTIFVIDVDQEGLPVAFLMSDRSDQIVVDIFISCIRDKIGCIETRTFITDMKTTYYDSWVKIMSQPEYFLFSIWHVKQAWLRNYNKVTDTDKRKYVKKMILDLAHEPNPAIFEEKLTSFTSIDDKDIEPFMKYFSENYLSTAHRWAYCFRQSAGLNTNMHLERFLGVFKRGVVRGERIETVHQHLANIFEYLAVKRADILVKEIKGKVTRKLRELRSRHRLAYKYFEDGKRFNVTSIDECTFLVDSFRRSDDSESHQDTYTIRKNEHKDCSASDSACRLLCHSCGFCYHEFRCACEDSAIRNNMCKHIHWLGLYLNKNSDCTPENRTNDENIPTQWDSSPEDLVDQSIITCENISESEDEEFVDSIVDKMENFVRRISVAAPEETLVKIYKQFFMPIVPFMEAEKQSHCDLKKGELDTVSNTST